MPESVKTEVSRAGIRFTESFSLTDEIVSKSDVLYVTRVQKERFENVAEYEAVKDIFVINNDVLEKAKESAIVMHPLPRVNEIDPEVDFDSKRAAYFRQMRYGLFVSCDNFFSSSGTITDPARRSEWLFLLLSWVLRVCRRDGPLSLCQCRRVAL